MRLPPLHSHMLRTICTEHVPVSGAGLGVGECNEWACTVHRERVLSLLGVQERVGLLAVHRLVVIPALHKVKRHVARRLAL